ncbi:FAD-dependent monooxygenase [Goodfellowiella coeruleoviolacea]|uniref:2-polyprenyl-6-methoxyphenol hydroxylase n=1 Tax=Goodfellowiella coeruleoviolacea TaxID=334858 RepID=A0AAE3KLN5_9PSEU|nr:FAD-dependent monooxygenase [Goodfellowiella coeruleoviolacea]MCP2166733.1 2-polyprenyl-6-methoxyphenol hydroxylase [Goodfellowiella coeruleoviolacea]
MTNTKVLISGASVAGPALAYWLRRQGCAVTVVERSAVVRESGYAVDFRGDALDVLERMGILAEVRAHQTRMRGTTVLDADGQQVARLPAEAFAGELEVPKSDLTRILHRITRDDVEYVFGDSIAAIDQHDTGVLVSFDHARPREFDLVIGADGVHSLVRRLVFGPHARFQRHLGMSGVGFTAANHLGLDHSGLLSTAPGRAVYLFSAADVERMTVSLSFATDSPELDRLDRAAQQEIVRDRFAGQGWEIPRLLDAMTTAEDFYCASSCQVEMDQWSSGRVALVGDAGYCAAPTSGMGTSQALIGAHLLATHLAAHPGDHRAAFAAYERDLRPLVTENQAKGREAATLFGA